MSYWMNEVSNYLSMSKLEREKEKNFNNHSTADPSGRSSFWDERKATKIPSWLCVCL